MVGAKPERWSLLLFAGLLIHNSVLVEAAGGEQNILFK
jgi:hypothetical protein